VRGLNFCAVLLVVAAVSVASASEIVRLEERNFKASAGRVTFSEYRMGTRNPEYGPEAFGGGPHAPRMRSGGWFVGQRLSANPGRDCPGAAASACVVGTPGAPLRLDPNSPAAFIARDGSFPTSPTLSGTPTFNGPIALWFDKDQVGVGFDGGYFNARASTGITAFARDGSRLGTVANRNQGIEFLGLVTRDGRPRIAGVMLDLVGAEPAGFNIDNIRFGQVEDLELPDEVQVAPPLIACCH
jgi:hypothetical protein